MASSTIYPSTTFHHYWSPFPSTLLASVLWPRAYTTVLSPNGDSCQQIMTVGGAVTIDHIANKPQNWRQIWQSLISPTRKIFFVARFEWRGVQQAVITPPPPPWGFGGECSCPTIQRNPQQSSTILNNPQQSSFSVQNLLKEQQLF